MGVITALILLANFNTWLWILPSVAIFVSFYFFNFEQIFCAVVYIAVFSGISPIFATALISCFVISWVRYIFDLIKKRERFFKLQFFCTLFFVLIFSLIFGNVDVNGVFNLIMSVCLLMFSYLVFVYAKNINIKKCFEALFVAMLVSALLGVALFSIDTIASRIYPFDGNYHRLKLFTLNANQLAIFCMFGISYVVYHLFNFVIKNDFGFLKSRCFWIDILKILLYAIVGFLTMSKAFLVVLVLVFVYVFALLALKLKLKSLFVILPMVLVVAVSAIIFKDFARNLISRFFNYEKAGSVISKIFTGRTEIWKEYLEYSSGSVWRILFGVGFATADVVDIGPHSIYIYLLYRIGIVGILAFAGLLFVYAKDAGSKIRITIFNILPIFIFLVYGLEEMILSDRMYALLILSILLLLVPRKTDKKVS